MKRALAYAKAVAERRRNESRRLAGGVAAWLEGWPVVRSRVCRVMLPDDLAVADADWSGVPGAGCAGMRSASDEVFNEAVRAVVAAGAVSVWGEFADGVHRLSLIGDGKVVAGDGPVPVAKLGALLRSRWRPAAMALCLGGYGSRVFDAAREALFGPLLAELRAALAEDGQ